MPAYAVCAKRFFRTLVMLMLTASAVLALTYAGVDLYGYKRQSERADVICLFGAAVWGDSPSAETPVSLSVLQRTRATAREELALFKDLLVFAVSPD